MVLSIEGCHTCIDYSCKDYSDCTDICGIPDRNLKYRTVKFKVACCFLMLIYIAGHESWRSSELNRSCAGTCIRQGHVTLQTAVLIACCGNVSLPHCLIVPPAITWTNPSLCYVKYSVETCCDDGLYLGMNLWSELLCSLGLLSEQLWSNQEGIQTGIVARYEVSTAILVKIQSLRDVTVSL